MPVTKVKTTWASGNLEFRDKDGNIIFTVDGTNRKVTFPSGASIDVSAATSSLSLAAGEIGAADLSANLKTGFIPLNIFGARIVNANDIGVKGATDGGLVSKDTTPILERVNAATDKATRLNWVGGDNSEIILPSVPYPPDLDDTANVTLKLLVAKDANANATANLTAAVFEGVGDTDFGSATAAITETSPTVKTVTLTAANVGAAPNVISVSLTPANHAGDKIYLYGAWLEYTRKS